MRAQKPTMPAASDGQAALAVPPAPCENTGAPALRQ